MKRRPRNQNNQLSQNRSLGLESLEDRKLMTTMTAFGGAAVINPDSIRPVEVDTQYAGLQCQGACYVTGNGATIGASYKADEDKGDLDHNPSHSNKGDIDSGGQGKTVLFGGDGLQKTKHDIAKAMINNVR